MNDPSKLACSAPGMEADSSPTARFDAHRPQCKHTIVLVWALGEQGRRTASSPTFLCADSARRSLSGSAREVVKAKREGILDPRLSNSRGLRS